MLVFINFFSMGEMEATFALSGTMPINKLLSIASYKDFERNTTDFVTS